MLSTGMVVAAAGPIIQLLVPGATSQDACRIGAARSLSAKHTERAKNTPGMMAQGFSAVRPLKQSSGG